jgi:hypothetical protein
MFRQRRRDRRLAGQSNAAAGCQVSADHRVHRQGHPDRQGRPDRQALQDHQARPAAARNPDSA